MKNVRSNFVIDIFSCVTQHRGLSLLASLSHIPQQCTFYISSSAWILKVGLLKERTQIGSQDNERSSGVLLCTFIGWIPALRRNVLPPFSLVEEWCSEDGVDAFRRRVSNSVPYHDALQLRRILVWTGFRNAWKTVSNVLILRPIIVHVCQLTQTFQGITYKLACFKCKSTVSIIQEFRILSCVR